MRLGVFGGTFNPIHYGHLRAAEDVRENLVLDSVIFVPTGTPPMKFEELAASGDRFAMTELAVSTNPHFNISDIESSRPEISYSVHTAKRLKEIHPGDEIFFITGIDAFIDIPRWREPDVLINLVDFIIISRPGYSFSELASSPYLEVGIDTLKEIDRGSITKYNARLRGSRQAILLSINPYNVSATSIRTLVSQKKSIKYLLPDSVESFIMSHGLYVG